MKDLHSISIPDFYCFVTEVVNSSKREQPKLFTKQVGQRHGKYLVFDA